MLSLLPIALLVPAILAVPMPARELCTCQPLRPSSQQLPGYNDSLASCNRIATDIERWRAAAFHHPDLADLFVDYRDLELSKSVGIPPPLSRDRTHRDLAKRSKLPELVSKIHMNRPPYRRGKNAAFSDPSPGRAVEDRTAATFLKSPQRFRILCQPRKGSLHVSVLTHFQWMILSFLLMAVLWLCIFEVLIDVWLRIASFSRPAEGTITLEGDEKALLACTADAPYADTSEVREEAIERYECKFQPSTEQPATYELADTAIIQFEPGYRPGYSPTAT